MFRCNLSGAVRELPGRIGEDGGEPGSLRELKKVALSTHAGFVSNDVEIEKCLCHRREPPLPCPVEGSVDAVNFSIITS